MHVQFRGITLDTDMGTLEGPEGEIRLRPKTFFLLEILVAEAPAVLTKDELTDRVWGQEHLGETSLAQAVSELRRALGDDPRKPRFVETMHRRGYRFIAPVEPPASPRTVVEAPTPPDAPIRRQPTASEGPAPVDRVAPPGHWGSRTSRLRWAAAILPLALGCLALLASGREGVTLPPTPASEERLPSLQRIVVVPSAHPGQGDRSPWMQAGLPFLTAFRLQRHPQVYVYPFYRSDAMLRDLPFLQDATGHQLAAAGRYLEADWLLRGRVSQAPEGKIHGRLELLSVDGSRSPWTVEGTFDEGNLAWVSQRWADSMLEVLAPAALPRRSRPRRHGPSLEALEKYFTAYLLSQRDPEGALDLLEEASGVAPHQAPILFARGWLLLQEGRLGEAQELSLQGRRSARSRRLKVFFLSVLGQSEGALRLLRSLPAELQGDPELWLESLQALNVNGQAATVLTWLEAMPRELRESWLEAEFDLLEAESAVALGESQRAREARLRAADAARRRAHHGAYARASELVAELR